jgi:putative peptidoglycan lipid II flippase
LKSLKADKVIPARPPNTAEAAVERRSITISALIFALGTLMSRVLGLLRDMMMARYFSNDVRDAFFNAFRLPNLFRRLFGEGSLATGFIPIFIDILVGRPAQGGDQARARDLVSALFSLLMSLTITISCLAILFMEPILRWLLNGEAYMSVPGKFELTVDLARIMFGFLILISLYAFFMAILNSLKKFAMTAIAPCFFNITMIALIGFSPRLQIPEVILGWGVLIGGFLQMVVLVPSVWRAGFFPRLSIRWSSPDLARVLKAAIPGLFGMSILQLSAIVNMHFASALASGSQSYLYFADRILDLPISLFVVSVSSALLPSLARNWAERDFDAMSETINHYLRLIFFLAFPAAIGMFVLAQPIVEVLFLGRHFSYMDAVATAHVIQVYAFAILAAAGVRILAQGFYAIHNTWFPALAGGVSLVAHVLFAYALTNAFGLVGLACASVGSATVNFIMLATAYSSWVGGLQLRILAKSGLKFSICGLLMAVALQLNGVVMHEMTNRFFTRAVSLGVTITVGMVVYFASAYVLKIPELHETVTAWREKFARNG